MCRSIYSYGQFVYTDLYSNYKNYIYQSSVCSNGKYDGYQSPIRFGYGEQQTKLVNVSKCDVSYVSAIYYSWGYSTKSTITYCSLNSNQANFECLELQNSGSSIYSLDTCNIINNKQDDDDYGLVFCAKNAEIKNCCILGNTGTDEFNLFYAKGVTITNTNCTLPCSYQKTGAIVAVDARPDSPFINKLIFTEKGYCVAAFDSIELTYCPTTPVRTPVISPQKSPDKTPDKTFYKNYKYLKEDYNYKNNKLHMMIFLSLRTLNNYYTLSHIVFFFEFIVYGCIACI